MGTDVLRNFADPDTSASFLWLKSMSFWLYDSVTGLGFRVRGLWVEGFKGLRVQGFKGLRVQGLEGLRV